MNGPFQVAQASTPGTTNNSSPVRIFNLTKPLGDQAVTINLGYDQKVKVDFSAIANEKITLVHLGEKLIILFDNKSTLTLEPFFDSRHDGLNNLSVEVAPGRDVSVSEFASLFPITTDQSVLPAAGDGNGNAQASGANFSPASVDPLGIRDPLALLGQEELGNFRIGQDQFDGTPTADRPTIVVGAGLALTVDESFIPVVGSGQLPAGSTVAVADYSSVFAVTAPGGVFSKTYALTATGTASNLIDSGTGQTVMLVQKGTGEVDGIVTIEGVAVTVFTLTVDAAGHVTMTDLRAVHEANPADSNDGISLAAGLVSLSVTVTDLNGNTGTGTIDLGPNVTILDDGPSITAREGELPSLTSDESFLTDVTNAGVNGTHTGFIGHTTDHHSFAGAFTSVAGADGATIAYTLGIGKPAGEGGLIDSGLIDSATGAHVVLVLTPAGVIEGHVGTAAGATVFTISVDAATAEVTLTQLRSVHESDTTNNHESTSLNSVANLVTLTATITDGDGDHAKASIDLGAHVTFYDDGPSIKAVSSEGEGEGSSFLHVDESYLTAATNGVDGTTPGLAGTADHASFAGMFIPVQGADHATVVYTLGIAAPSPSGESQSSLVDSGLVDSATGQEVVLVLTAGGVVEGHVGTTGGALVFTLAVDAATAEVTLTQLRSVHEGNPNSNNEGISLDLVSNLVTLTATITDNDGDHAAASIDLGARVTFYDDGPTLSVTAGEGAAVVDETPGLQTASGATDVAFSTLSGAAQALFTAVLNKGSDPDVSHDHGAIGYAVGSGLVTATVNYGADHGQSEVFALTLGNDGMDSGLKTTEGREIFLFLENGVIVGRYDSPNDGNTTVNHSDPAAFAIAIDPATGDISIAQYVSLNHPAQATATDGFNSYNEAISLATGTVSIAVTVTDKDNDSVTKSADVSGEIRFLDDGPKVTVVVDRCFSVVLDETPGVQSQDDDTTSSSVRHLFDLVANTGNDPDLSSGQKDHGAIGFAIGNNAALDVIAVFGADGPTGECTNVFSLTLNGISGSVDSGLQTTDGKEIYLTLEHGMIVGRVDTDGDQHVTTSDPAAFAIAIDGNGHVATAEYLSLHHGDPHADDESVQLASGTVSATVTITDGDGDTASASADISGKIQFEDDVPVAHDVTAGTILDDEAQSLFPANFGGSGDVSPSVNTTSGGAGTLFDSGADGTKTVSFAQPSGLQAIYKLPSGFAGQETVHYTTTVSGDHTILTAIGDVSGNTVFTLNVGADGSYVFKVSEPLVDPVHSTTEENLSIKIGFTVTDGDGDHDTGSLTVKVNDDTPTVEVDQAQHDRHDVTLSTLTLDESIGAMVGDSNAATDDVPGVTAPSLLTSIDASKAIGIISTPTSALGTSVAELFDTHVSFGADGPKAAAVSTYSFTLKDDHGNTVSNSHTGVETNLVVTELAGTALQGTTDAQRTVYLFQAADGSIVGRIGNNPNGDIALHIVITGSASDPQITVEQYLPVEHSNHGSADESTSLTFEDRDAGLGITLTVTATDGDGDVATDSKTVSLADCNTSLIKIEDDGPTVTLSATSATVVHDETSGLQTAADPNAANDVHFIALLGTVQTAFTNVSNPGSDPDLTLGQMDHGAIGYAKSAAPLVTVATDFGTDGHAINNAQILALAIAGGNGVNSGLKTTDGHEIDLFLENGLIVGRYDGSDADTTITNSPGHVDPAAFAIAISQDGTISLAQYVSLFNPTPGASYDEAAVGLKSILATVTVTDGDGDTATKSVDISGQIQFQDDGPTVTLSATSATVVHDETPGLQTAADPNAANDVHFIALSGTVQTAFTNVSNPGSDPDLTAGQMDHGAIGYAKSAAPLVTVATDFGTDGHAINNAQILALAIAGGNGVNSGLKTTDGHEIDLFLENGLIVGRYDGSDADTTITNSPGHVDPAAFAIAISQDGTISLAQYVSLFNPTPGASYDEAAVGLKSILATVTVTDGDGDTATKSVDISGQIQFQDDGPTLTVTAPAAINGLDFGNFVLNNNAWGNGSGVATGTNGGWTIANSDDGQGGSGAVQLERVGDGYQGMHSSTGGYMVDLDASPHDVKISQTITGLTAGQTYDLRFEAGAPFPNQAHLEVWFGGVKIAPDVTLTGQMQEYKITLTGGSGDGSNLLEFRETGAPDNQGTYLANVSVGEIVIDETAGIQSDSNEVAANSLFNAVAHQGTDPDMAPQFAQGTSAAVSVTASFGADGPAASGATVYSLLTTNNVDSGLTTTAGQSIHLFNETYSGVTFVVGRYDSNNSGTIDSADDAAFAFRIDPGTGKLSLVQYVSLHQPNTASNDEGVFLNTGSLSVNVTITDGDGDTIAKSADISANIRFDDDGPVATSATVSAGEVYEDGLLTGNPEGAPGSQPTSITITQANLGALVHFGADGPGGFGFNSAADGTSSGLSSDGSAISYHIAGDTLSGVTVDGRTIFTLVDTHDGNFKFTLLGNVDHGPLNSGLGDSETLTLNLASLFTATDGDGDTVVLSGGLNVTIENDIPVVTTNTNLIVNGSFEDGHPDLGNGQWSIYHTLPGWTSADIGATGPHGDVPFEVQTGAVGGVPAEDGNALIELDSDLSSGNLSGGDHFNDSGHTNATIQQVVHATESGQTYELTFWYAPRPSEGDDHSGSMEVLWNGNVVKTIDSMGMTPGVWQQITVFVEGTGPDNVLGFHGTGQENSLGAFIDNVSLVAAAIVDEDGLPSGNHDSQPGDIVVPNGDGDSNEATATGLLNIKWGADDFNGGADTHGGGNPANGFVQDTSGRKVTFTDDTVGITGGALTSHGDTVVLSVSSDGTVLTGTATHGTDAPRTVFEVSLSDDGSGAFRFILKDALDHTTGQNENNIVLSFNYTATDSDGDKAPGSFQVLVNDDVPVAAAEPLQSLVEGTTLSGHFDFAPGADGATVTHVNGVALVFGVDGYSQPIATDHGTLAVKADGSYLFTAQADDFYLTGGQVTGTFTVTDHDGDPSTAGFSFAVTDDADVTTVTLSDVTVFEGAGTATILASVDHAPQGSDLVLSLSNGSTVTILAGHTTGTSTPFAVQGDDPYVDHESYVVSVSGATGGNYEALNTTDTSTVTVNDTITPNHITLDDVTVLENQTIVYTAHMDYASSTPFSITLSNNVVLTFAPGSFVATSAPQPAQGDDVYLDGEVKTVSISSTSGGNFEAVNITDTATVTITDTIDPVTATLTTTTSTVSDTGGSITYVVTLSSGLAPFTPKSDLVFTLTNGETVTIPAGQTSGSTTHVYSDADITNQVSITDAIASVTGGTAYESLLTTGTTNVPVFHLLTETGSASLTVSEAALDTTATGNDILPGLVTGSNPSSPTETAQSTALTFTAGSDNISGIVFGATAGISVAGATGTFAWVVNGSGQLEGHLVDANGPIGIILSISGPTTAASGGTATPTITATLTDNFPHAAGNGDVTVTGITLVASDTSGHTASGAVSVTITDDVPAAHADSGNVTEGALLTVAATGVLANDTAGADGVSIAGVRAAGVDLTTAVATGIGTNITGLHGTLNLHADGSYTYQSTANNITSNTTDTFVYTIKDGDGDLSTTTLTINLSDVTLVANNQTKTVNEAALDTTTTGSDLGHGTVTGSLGTTDAGETVTGTLAVAGATGYTAQSVTGTHGLFQLNANGTYTYTLTTPVTESPAANNGTDTVNGVESFSYTAHDANNNIVTGTITINVTDDVPTAVADSGNVTEGALLTVAATGVLANDTAGADGASIAGVRAAGADLTTAVATGVGTDITGLHGTLHLNTDGSYTYQSTANNITANTTDKFVYTIKDGDGDLSTTTLTINLSDVTLVANNQTKTVNEAALDTTTTGSDLDHGTVTGSLGTTSPAETVTGTLAVTGATGYTAQSVTGTHGLFQLNANGTYTYTLTTPVTESPAANNGTDTVNGVESFSYTAHDANNNTVTGTVTINVTDDVPTANADAALTVLETAAATSGVNLLANDVQGADGAKVTGVDFGDGGGLHAIAASGTTTLTTSNGIYTFQANGTWTFDPSVNPSNSNTTGNFTYTITDGDGDTSAALQTVNITNANSIPVAGTDSFTVNEDGLTGGIVGGPGDVGGTTISHGGTLPANFGADGAASSGAYNFTQLSGAVLDSAGHAVTSGGAALSYFWDNTGHVLYASTNVSSLANAQATDAFTVSLNTTNGAYTFTEIKPIDHPGHDADGANNGPETAYEDNLTVNIGYQVTDSNGDHSAAAGTLAVTINDDTPSAVGDTATVSEGQVGKTDILVMLDVSQSMDSTVPGVASNFGFGNTRLDLARYALLQLVQNSSVDEVKIVLFRGSDRATVWLDKASAITFINNEANFDNSALGSGTNYDAALFDNGAGTDKGGTHAFDTNPTTPGDARIAYFLSDGEPTEPNGSIGISTSEETTWINYLNAHSVTNAYAIGFGDLTTANANALEPVAVSPGEVQSTFTTAAADDNVFVIVDSDFSSLGATLSATVPSSVNGNVSAGTVSAGTGGTDHFGADGGRILSITVNGTTYTWDGSNTITETGAITGTLSGNSISANTSLGGHLNFFFSTVSGHVAGDWNYTAPNDVPADSQEVFHYVIKDNDGDTAAADLTVNITAVDDAPLNTVPAAQTVNEDTALVFNAAHSNLIQVSDVDANGGLEQVTLTVSHGTLSLFTVSGLNFTAGDGTADATMTFKGTIAAINAALNGLTYQGVQDHNGADTLTITTNDLGNTGTGGPLSDTDNLAITVTAVNDAPTITSTGLTLVSNSGSGAVAFAEAALSAYGADVDNTILGVGAVTAVTGLQTVSGTNLGNANVGTVGTITVDDDNTLGGTFTFTISDGTSSSSPATTVTFTNSATSNATLTAAGSGDSIIVNSQSGVAATLTGGSGRDYIIGNSASDIIVGAANDIVLDGGGGTDTLKIGASFTSTSDAQIVNIENVLLTVATSIDFTNQTEDFTVTGSAGVDSIKAGSGADIIVGAQNDALLDGGGGTDTLQVGANFTSTSDAQIANIENVTLTAAVTLDLSNQTEAFNITGSSGADVIKGGSGADTITGGLGADTMTGNGGSDTFVIATGDSTVAVGGTGNTGTITGYDIITDFDVTADKLNLPGTVVLATTGNVNGGGDSTLTIGGDTVESHSVNANGIATFFGTDTFTAPLAITSLSGVAAVVQYLSGSDIGAAGATLAFTATISGVNHTYIYEQAGSSAGLGAFVDLQNVTITNLTALVGNHVDPIILDLDNNGFAFTSSADGVAFDLNGDGVKDQVAWTTNGQDGILALDVNGSGKIESGNELFTPTFAGGHFANGIAALASLDTNHDGVIDSHDPAFSQLVVWQDANHNGVSDSGELAKLSDLGIKSIDLATMAGTGPIDGQNIAAIGSFTYVNGTKGSFVEADLDTSLVTPSSTPASDAAGTHHDLPKGGMEHVVDFTPTGHGELNFAAINPGVPAGGEQSHFTFVDAPLMHDTYGDNSAAAAKMALAILQAGGTVDTAHLPVAH